MMIAFRTLRRVPGTASALLAVMLFASPVQAQVRLLSDTGADTGAEQSVAETKPKDSRPSGVSVESLGAVDVEAIGALPTELRALPPTLWNGLSRGSVEALLNGLPASWALPSARPLALRLLLSPAGIPPAAAPDRKGAILRARIRGLLRLGAAAEAVELARVGQDILVAPDDALLLAETKLSAFDLVGACGDAGRNGAGSAEAFWQKLLIFCQAVAGNATEAALAAQTLLEFGNDDPVFFSLMEDIGLGLTADLRSLDPAGPLHYAMLRYAKSRLATSRLAKGPSDPAIARLAVAQDPDVDRAEAALARGLIPIAVVADKYARARFKASALENPIAVLNRVSVPARRALLFQAIGRYQLPVQKAEAIAAALAQSRQDGRLAVAAQLFVEQAKTIPVSADMLWFAEDAAQLFYMAGHTKHAAEWHGLARTVAGSNQEAASVDHRLWHLAALSGQSGAALTRSRQGWARAIAAASDTTDKDESARRVSALTALVEAATGAGPSGQDRAARMQAMTAPSVIGPASGPSPLLMQRLVEASISGREGETVALALAALSHVTADRPDLATLIAVVSALRRVGLLAEARRLALEAAVLSNPVGS